MEKIKKSMRREDGFTLVELLAVIVILGIILAIAIPAIGNVIDNSKADAAAAEYDLVIDAGRLYFTAEANNDEVDLSDGVEVEDLASEGYLEGAIEDFLYVIKTDVVKRSSDGKYELYKADDSSLARPTRDSYTR